MADIKINKLNKFYGNLHIIKDVDIEIEDKSFTVLVGPSGSGKSTMLKPNVIQALRGEGKILTTH